MYKAIFKDIIDLIDHYTDIKLYIDGQLMEEKFRSYSFPDRYDLHDYLNCEIEEIRAVGQSQIAIYLKS